MNRAMRDLLFHIVDHYATADDERRIELDANAELSGSEIDHDKAAAAERERETAEALASAFEDGLRLAWRARQRGNEIVSLDDREPRQDAMATALVDYLVRFDLATSGSRELGGQHYIYDIAVNWNRLRDVARENGQRLDDLFEVPVEQSET